MAGSNAFSAYVAGLIENEDDLEAREKLRNLYAGIEGREMETWLASQLGSTLYYRFLSIVSPNPAGITSLGASAPKEESNVSEDQVEEEKNE